MHKTKKGFCILMAGLMAVSLMSCASNEGPSIQQLPDEFLHPASVACGPTDGRQTSDYQFGFLWGGQSEYYQVMPKMFDLACSELEIPVPLDATPKNWIQEEQNERIDSLLAKGVKGICMMPSEEVSSNEKIDELVESGIPVVCIGGAPAEPSRCVLTLSTDVYQCAYDATLTVLEALDYEGNIMAITGAVTDINSAKRLQAIADACSQYSNVKVLDQVAGISDQSSGLEIVGQLLEEQGDRIDGVVAMDYYAAYAMAYYLLRDDSYNHITCVGIDSDPLVLEAIRRDKMLGSMSQNPWAQGYLSVYSLKMLIDGWTYKTGQPSQVDTGSFLITKELVNDFEGEAIALTMELAATWTDRFNPPADLNGKAGDEQP